MLTGLLPTDVPTTKTSKVSPLQSKRNFAKLQTILTEVKNVEHRRVLTKLRNGYNCLSLVKGRQTNVDRQERLCPLCKLKFEDTQNISFLIVKTWLKQTFFLLASLKELDVEFQQRPVKTLVDATLMLNSVHK